MMIKRFLVPVDLAFAEPAFVAIRLARYFRAEIIFFHCLPASALMSGRFFPKPAEAPARHQISPEERRLTEARISAFESLLPLAGLSSRWQIAKGAVLPEILKTAGLLRPDWIIQGSRRSSALEEWIPGGTAWWTIQKAPCPVITVKHHPQQGQTLRGAGESPLPPPGSYRSEEQRPPPFREILYLSGSGKSSDRALPAAAALANKSGAGLVILHIAGQTLDRKPGTRNGAADPGGRVQQLVEKARMLQVGLKVSSLLVAGDPEEAVLARIQERVPDMIVMGVASIDGMGLLPTVIFRDRIFHRTACPIMTVNQQSAGLERRFRKLLKKLTPKELILLSEEHPETIGEELFSDRSGSRASSLFLRNYSAGGLLRLFEESGIMALLRERGFTEPKIAIHMDDPFLQRMRVFFGETEDDEHTLIEMILREGVLEAPPSKESGQDGRCFSVLIVEWLAMQDPTAPFSPERPPLPDQRHPGLGMSREIIELIALIGTQIGKEGIAIHPRFFHAAVIYHRHFKCFNPVQEGQLAALIRDTEAYNLNDVSWAAALECLEGTSLQQGVPWKIDYQVRPLTALLRQHFQSDHYRNLFWNSLANHHYHVDCEKLDRCLRELTGGERMAP